MGLNTPERQRKRKFHRRQQLLVENRQCLGSEAMMRSSVHAIIAGYSSPVSSIVPFARVQERWSGFDKVACLILYLRYKFAFGGYIE